MALYRPGQSRLSTCHSRSERDESGETCSSSPSPVMPAGEPNVYLSQGKKDSPEVPKSQEDSDEVRMDIDDRESDSGK